MKRSLSLDIPVTNLQAHWKGIFEKLPENSGFTLVIDYPVSTFGEFKIKTGKNGMGLIQLLEKIGKCYQEIYDNEDKYGVWGHSMDDLAIEGIDIDYDKKVIRLHVGS